MLKELNINYDEPDDLIRRRIDKLEEETESTLDEQQKRAVAEAVKHGIFILTGGLVQERQRPSMR